MTATEKIALLKIAAEISFSKQPENVLAVYEKLKAGIKVK